MDYQAINWLWLWIDGEQITGLTLVLAVSAGPTPNIDFSSIFNQAFGELNLQIQQFSVAQANNALLAAAQAAAAFQEGQFALNQPIQVGNNFAAVAATGTDGATYIAVTGPNGVVKPFVLAEGSRPVSVSTFG